MLPDKLPISLIRRHYVCIARSTNAGLPRGDLFRLKIERIIQTCRRGEGTCCQRIEDIGAVLSGNIF